MITFISQCNRVLGSFIALFTVGLLVVACGGGGGSSNESGNTSHLESGVFLDSAVGGLEFTSVSSQGVTDHNGSFQYAMNDPISFSVGGIVLGSVSLSEANAHVTPVDLIPGATDETHPEVINIARFLQTIDDDGIAENGITINALTRSAASNLALNFKQPTRNFGNDPNVISAIQILTAETTKGSRKLVETHAAQNHLAQTIASQSCSEPLCITITTMWSDQFAGSTANYYPAGTGTEPRYVLMAPRKDFGREFHAKAAVTVVTSNMAVDLSKLVVRLAEIDDQNHVKIVGDGSIDSQDIRAGHASTVVSLFRPTALDFRLNPVDYHVVAWLDEGIAGRLEDEQATISVGWFRVVSDSIYVTNTGAANIGQMLSGFLGFPIAREMLRNFLVPNARLSFDPEEYIPIPLSITSIPGELTHNVGIDFRTSPGTIRNFHLPFNSSVSQQIRASKSFQKLLAAVFSDRTSEVVATNLSNGEKFQFDKWPISNLKGQKIIPYDKQIDTDLYLAFGTSTINATVQIEATCVEQELRVTSINVEGRVIDIYDWNYEKDPNFDRRAAMIQAGYGSLGESGQVFRTDVQIDGPIEPDNLTGFPSGYVFGECGEPAQYKLEYVSGDNQTYSGGGMPFPMTFRIFDVINKRYVEGGFDGLRIETIGFPGFEDFAWCWICFATDPPGPDLTTVYSFWFVEPFSPLPPYDLVLTINAIDQNTGKHIEGSPYVMHHSITTNAPPPGGGTDPNADSDGDGYTPNQGDCNDSNPAVNPGAIEIPYNGIDDDCDPSTLEKSGEGCSGICQPFLSEFTGRWTCARRCFCDSISDPTQCGQIF